MFHPILLGYMVVFAISKFIIVVEFPILRNLLGYYMIAELSFVAHYSEVEIVTAAKVCFWHDLIFTRSAFNGPHNSSARRKSVPTDETILDGLQGFFNSFSE